MDPLRGSKLYATQKRFRRLTKDNLMPKNEFKTDPGAPTPHFSKQTITERFGPYRKPTDETIPKYEKIQKLTLELAKLIDVECPNSPEKYTALTHLQLAKMSANAAVAIYS